MTIKQSPWQLEASPLRAGADERDVEPGLTPAPWEVLELAHRLPALIPKAFFSPARKAVTVSTRLTLKKPESPSRGCLSKDPSRREGDGFALIWQAFSIDRATNKEHLESTPACKGTAQKSFIQRLFLQHLLWFRLCARCWGDTRDRGNPELCPLGAYTLLSGER